MMFQIFEKRMKITPLKIVVFLIVIALLVVGGLFAVNVAEYYRAIQGGDSNPLLNQRLESSISSAIANREVTDADLARLYKNGAPSIVPANARLTVVEFLDFGCPFCRSSFEPIREMTAKYKDDVRLIVRDFPIENIHPGATLAAHAARCAHEQGKYWAYHDKLFLNQNAFAPNDLEQYAVEVGADRAKFNTCMVEERYMRSIETDIADGLATGVQGTPTFFFNGHRIQGALNEEMLSIIIEQFLNPEPTE